MKFVFCANCGMKLIISRKAMPKYGCIIDLVEQHTCAEEFIPPDLTPTQVPTFVKTTEVRKFANKLDEMQPQPVPFDLNETGLRDRRDSSNVRSDESTTTAPRNLLDALKRDLD